MKYLNIFLTFIQILVVSAAIAQDNTYTLRGTVIDSGTKEPLVGANIRLSGTWTGTQSDIYGKFSLTLTNPEKNDSLIVSYVGYKTHIQVLSDLKNNDAIQISMISQATTLKEVVVRSEFWLKQYTPKELKEDYTKFYTILEKVHTGLYDYLPEREWQAMKDSSLRLCQNPMTHSEFYQLIAYHVGKVRNVHTRHGVTDWWYRQKQNIFPFNIRYFGDRMYVGESLVKELVVPKGSEILSINGRTPVDIRAMIWPYIPADGYIQTGKAEALNYYFPWYFALFVEEAESFTIEIKTPDGKSSTLTTAGLRDSFGHLSFQQVMKWKQSALELQIDNKSGTAYFRIDDSRVFKDSLKPYFRRISDQKVQHLIIDLRGGGGMREEEQVAELYSHLIKTPSTICDSILVKSNDYTLFDKDFSYKPYGKSLKHIKEEYFDLLVNTGAGYYLWKNESYLGPIKPANVQYTGKVYILVDGRTYSASTDFVAIASRLANVVVIGEETCGANRSYISGAMFGLVLPNSRIGIKVPTWKTILAFKEDPSMRGRGVIPDYPISATLADFINDTDVVKEFVYKLIAAEE